MNERIRELAQQSDLAELYDRYVEYCMKNADDDIMDYDTIVTKFAEMILKECAALNKTQSYDLMGVIVDAEEGDGFDDVCLTTVKRVADYLGDNSLAKHFGVEE